MRNKIIEKIIKVSEPVYIASRTYRLYIPLTVILYRTYHWQY